MEKGEGHSICVENKSKIRVISYGTLIIGAVVVGLIVGNVFMFNYMNKRFDLVSWNSAKCMKNLTQI